MKATKGQGNLRELVRSFDALRILHEQLFKVLEAKIEAMRGANVPAMEAANQDEQLILKTLREKEGRRAALMQSLSRECGIALRAAKVATVSQIAALLPAVERELLQHAAARLQETIARTAQANRIASSVARGVTNHLKFVFSAIRPAAAPVGYSVRGETPASGAAIMDVVG